MSKISLFVFARKSSEDLEKLFVRNFWMRSSLVV
jgi:hypothetical protein